MNDRDTATELRRVGCALSETDVARLRIVAFADSTSRLEPLAAALRSLDAAARIQMSPLIDTTGIAPGRWARTRFTSYARGPMDENKRWHLVLSPPIPVLYGATGRAQVVYLCGRSANFDLVKAGGYAGWFWVETFDGDWPATGPGCLHCLRRATQLGWLDAGEL
jgi:hypothetical protein